ncbi:MAG: TetR/AcrR family transcriptional regulator [Yoonia sp.]|uniref:TetR/AcrR family transcriptional regulator n=1 Tax=Yoonia sp. TaxID=2212373 RepID=UPI003EF0AFBF
MASTAFEELWMTKNTKLSKRERNLADIRERAIPTAEQIVLTEGIDALSARRLAKEIDVSVGSLYNAFGDLDAVVGAAIAKSAVMLSEVLHAASQKPAPDPQGRVIAIGEAYLDFALAEPMRWLLLFEYRANIAPDVKVQEFQLGLLEMLITAGGGDPKSEAEREFFLLLWASVHGLVSLASRPTIIAIKPEVARTYLGDMVRSGFKNRDAG